MDVEFLPQRPLSLGISEVGRRRVDTFPLLLGVHRGAVRSWKDRARRRGSAPSAGRPDITQSSSLITSTPTRGSGAGAGTHPHWSHPGGGVSSSGTSTTAT
jgi:hypothetical protein